MQRKGCNFPVKINVKHAPSVQGSCFVSVTIVNMRHRALEIGAGIKYGDDMHIAYENAHTLTHTHTGFRKISAQLCEIFGITFLCTINIKNYKYENSFWLSVVYRSTHYRTDIKEITNTF